MKRLSKSHSNKSKQKLSLKERFFNRRKVNKAKKEAAKIAVKKRRADFRTHMPKKTWQKVLYYINPVNFWKYWFNSYKFARFWKIIGVLFLIGVICMSALFIYYRKELTSIETGDLSSLVSTTANTYLDRNGNVLWVDTGTDDYKLVVDDDELSQYLKDATVAIEDKDFYKHGGISISGIIRAALNNIIGGSTQGGSTLTQQVIKQVFLSDEASNRGLSGIPRKIKEIILSIEVERMYTKAQILDLYLNESPYGGRRNGAESAAQTYFNKSAKDLTLAEAALLAAIPQSPSYFNPYNTEGNEDLIARQHKVLDKMVEQGYITKDQADEAKAYDILANIEPESSQYENVKGAHFVQYVKAQLEDELGLSVMGKGGLTITTTLDIRIQDKLEEAMDDMFNSSVPNWAGFDNGAATVEDTETGQIVAMLGSRDFSYENYGQNNAAVAYLQPGSSVKPLVYSELFEDKGSSNLNYGSGSILNDTNIDSLYGGTLRNADQKFNGPMTIRSALATSRNIPAVEAMYINGVSSTLDTMHDLGATSYCTQGTDPQVGLAAAIGGCGVEQVDLVNAYASLSRMGVYKPQSTVLKVVNNEGDTLKQWTDTTGTRVISEQSAYIVADILHDDVARAPLDGRHATGMEINGVDTATKTGTSDKGGDAKDIWMMSYSTVLAMGVWLGNADGSILTHGTSSIPGSIIETVMSYAHKEVYASEGKWTSGDWFSAPSGIQTVSGEVYPSWWSASQNETTKDIDFDILSKKKATNYTPEGSKISIKCTKVVDPITKKEIYIASDTSYDATADDDVHLATDTKPTITLNVVDNGDNTYTVTATVKPGSVSGSVAYSITTVKVTIGGSTVTMTNSATNTYTYIGTLKSTDVTAKSISATVTDSYYYTGTDTDETPVYE